MPDVVHSGEKINSACFCNIGRFSCIVMIVGSYTIVCILYHDAYWPES